jgi:hypothetical protein
MSIEISPETKKKFEKYVFPEPNTGCWLWAGAVTPRGYGRFGVNRKTKNAVRVSYTIFNGQIPDKLFVLHKCDIPACVNPDHLFLGTNRDNVDDMLRKGRSRSGEKHPNAKLTRSQVMEIRASKLGSEKIGRLYSIHERTVRNIRNRTNWKSVE